MKISSTDCMNNVFYEKNKCSDKGTKDLINERIVMGNIFSKNYII